MTPEEYASLLQQHVELLVQIRNLWIALVVAGFIGLIFIGLMMFAAAWSVANVNKQTTILFSTYIQNETRKREELEAKFVLLIDALLGRIGRQGNV
jgi:hypothetical protein